MLGEFSTALQGNEQDEEGRSEALITPDRKIQQQNVSAGSSSRRLFADKNTQKEEVLEEGAEVQSRKRPCECSTSYAEAEVGGSESRQELPREQAKRQATRRLFGETPSAEQLELYFRAAEEEARTTFKDSWSLDVTSMQPVKDGRWKWIIGTQSSRRDACPTLEER